MTDNSSPLTPCRRKINRGRVKKALTAFIGTCGAAAVMTLAIDSSRAQPAALPAGAKGEGLAVRIATSDPATAPAATRPATPTTVPVALPGLAAMIKVQTQPAK